MKFVSVCEEIDLKAHNQSEGPRPQQIVPPGIINDPLSDKKNVGTENKLYLAEIEA